MNFSFIPHLSSSNNKSGFAVALVLIFSGLTVFMLSLLWRHSTAQRHIVQRNFGPLQAKLIALSGIQHLLVKAKLFPTELYDAWALAKGRNPLFDFGIVAGVQPPAGANNPGPRFVTRGSVGPDAMNDVAIDVADDFTSDPGGWFTSDAFAGNIWPKISGTSVRNSQIYLWKFCADVTNVEAIQPALAVKKPAGGFDGTTGDPYDATYEVASISVLGQKDRKGYWEDVINLQVKGRALDLHGGIHEETISRSISINRR